MGYLRWLIICAIFNAGLCNANDQPCKKRATKYGYVCVCDYSYCDTVERPPALQPGQFHRYTTSNTSPGFTRTLGHFSDFSSDAEYVFTLNTSMPCQEVFGIGGSFTDTVGLLYKNLSEAAQDKFLESYYGINGIEYSMGRVPIGASDYSPRRYTFDNVPFDDDLKYFSLAYEDINYKIPLIQKAIALSARGLKLIGCAWSVPDWMRVSNKTKDAYVKQNYSSTWAKYHVKFLDAYKREGIEFWGLSGGNEVMLGFMIPNFMPMVCPPLQQRDWFKNHLKPQLVAANFSDVKLIALDDMRFFALYMMRLFSDDPEAYEALDAIALHWYWDRFIPPSVLDRIHQRYPEKHILYTETSVNSAFGSERVELGGWTRAEAYANSIMETLNHWSQTYLDWNLILNSEGGPNIGTATDAPVIINTTSGEFYKQPMFYALGHFSKFIPPGSRVVKVNSGHSDAKFQSPLQDLTDEKTRQILTGKLTEFIIPILVPSNVQCTATANSDGSYSIFLLNSKNTTAKVWIEDPQVGSISYPMEPHSLDTIVYWT